MQIQNTTKDISMCLKLPTKHSDNQDDDDDDDDDDANDAIRITSRNPVCIRHGVGCCHYHCPHRYRRRRHFEPLLPLRHYH